MVVAQLEGRRIRIRGIVQGVGFRPWVYRTARLAGPLAAAAKALQRGLIVAIKSIGGVPLACDATSDLAVRTLRERTRREAKPLAVMVEDLDAAEALAMVGAGDKEARRLLTSVERPIVVLPKHSDRGVAESVAPHHSMVGLFLPHSPLHHLLLAEAPRPLVMTSRQSVRRTDRPSQRRGDPAPWGTSPTCSCCTTATSTRAPTIRW